MFKEGRLRVAFAFAVLIVAVGAGSFYLFFNKSTTKEENSGNPIVANIVANFQDMSDSEQKKTYAVMKTNFGNISLELFPADAPKTVENFVALSRAGFYDGTKFHRVIKDFMIQGGDPNSKDGDWTNDGAGGPGYSFEDEINSHKIVKGVLAMANAGPNTNGSQFFIVTADAAPWLDGRHTVFGKVADGMENVLKIENVKTDKARGDHPIDDVIVESIEIVEM